MSNHLDGRMINRKWDKHLLTTIATIKRYITMEIDQNIINDMIKEFEFGLERLKNMKVEIK